MEADSELLSLIPSLHTTHPIPCLPRRHALFPLNLSVHGCDSHSLSHENISPFSPAQEWTAGCGGLRSSRDLPLQVPLALFLSQKSTKVILTAGCGEGYRRSTKDDCKEGGLTIHRATEQRGHKLGSGSIHCEVSDHRHLYIPSVCVCGGGVLMAESLRKHFL